MTTKDKLAAIIAPITLTLSGIYLVGGFGWYSDPAGYAIAWLIFIISAAHMLPAVLIAAEAVCWLTRVVRGARRHCKTSRRMVSSACVGATKVSR